MKKSIAENAQRFPSHWYRISGEGHFWFEWRFWAFLDQLQRLKAPVTERRTGLEIGCGNGLVQRQVESVTSWIVDGVDLKREALEKHGGSRGRSFLYNVMDLRDDLKEAYDFLLLFDILEHVNDPQTFLAASLYHLKTGGWVFTNVPALNFMKSRYDEVVGHLRRYNKKTLRRELELQKIVVQDENYWGFAMLPLLAMRMVTSKLSRDSARVLKRGLDPGVEWVNRLMLAVMQIDKTAIRRPFLGTSLLMAGVYNR